MDLLKDLIEALSHSQFALDLNTPVRVVLYGVTQKAIVRIERITEADVPKIVLYLEEFDQTDRDEQIRIVSG